MKPQTTMLSRKGETATNYKHSVRGNADALAQDDAISDGGSRKSPQGLHRAKLKRAIDYIHAHLSEDLKTLDIAGSLGMSQYHFSRLFKQSTGMTVHGYVIEQRVNKAMQLLRETDLSILAIADRCCFANPSHLARCFRKSTGLSPSQYRLMEDISE
jgi:transcriptional regulator GlxA family with amidase domain